jgi:vancomycin resistance protein VanW
VKNKKLFSTVIIGLSLVLLIFVFFINKSRNNYGVVKDQEKTATTKVGIVNEKNNMDLYLSYDLKSGPITVLPWENEGDFIKAVKDNGNLSLLAAYHTVLKDPLPGEEYNVHLAAKMLAGKVINPGQVFSQNNKIGPYTEDRGFRKGPTYIGSLLTTTIGGGVCKIASTLYNVAIMSDLEIVERHAHGMPVPYVPHGQDATVAYGGKDFKFRNNTDSPILIWAQGIDNTLFIAFYGKVKPREIEWHHQTLNVTKAPRIYKYSENISKDTEKLVLEGPDGATVRSWLTIKNENGTIETKQLGISYYNPMAYIIEKGR